jgi:GNAT superfamily N-acetyltransferase
MLGGMAWERMHRHRRSARPPAPVSVGEPGADARAAPPRAESAPLPGLRFETSALRADDYIALLRRINIAAPDAVRTDAALQRSINISAWHDNQLVGAARILSDGYFTAALAEIIVDPDYRRRGLGRELMNRAYAKTPRGTLSISAPQGSTTFFDHIGCERGPAGFIMFRTSKAPAS